ncbi:MAG: histidinol-phosphatase [Nitrospirota bacterium]|nr:histidinol-phosphatase [Nitrospirota bacterium]MDP2382571.1 histidinol-phosphatase [Nitrospirota bacterium]MDP3597011.1 histidinol-phosphatase [Nitrospirota bacterium]
MITSPQHNQQVAGIFRAIAERLSTQRANPYRVRAYRMAADAIEALEEDIADVSARQALEDIDGIGRDLADKIEEFLRTGTIQAYETLRTPLPESVKAWAHFPGLSESLVAYLHTRLCITTLTDLERLVRSHMLRTVPGFSGSEERLLEAITASQQPPPFTTREEAP